MVDPGHDAGHGELLLGQQRDDEVVLVVAGGRHDDVDRGQAGRVERGDLAGVGGHPGDVEGGAQPLDQLGVLLEDEHLVAVGVQVRGDGGADAPGAGDGDLHCPTVLGAALGAGQHVVELAQRVVEHGDVQDVALLADQLAAVEAGHAGAGHRHEAQAPGLLDLAEGPAGPVVGQRAVDQGEAPGGVGPVVDVLVGQQAPPDLVDGPRDRGHGGDPEPLVDLGPAGVVDAGHHVGDLVGLPGDAHGQDVGVVAAGHRGQRVRLERAGLLEVVAVEPRPHDAGAVPLLEAAEGLGRLVQDGHRMALGAEGDGEARPDAATPDDDRRARHSATRRARVCAKSGDSWAIPSTVWPWRPPPPRRPAPRSRCPGSRRRTSPRPGATA